MSGDVAIRRQILLAPHPSLMTHAKRVEAFDDRLRALVDDLWRLMDGARGSGLSAPQVGEALRVLVATDGHRRVALVNPCILKSRGCAVDEEGCLSLPGVCLRVPRKTWLLVSGRDVVGERVELQVSGWLARVIQHEIDHLDGILITDRARSASVRL